MQAAASPNFKSQISNSHATAAGHLSDHWTNCRAAEDGEPEPFEQPTLPMEERAGKPSNTAA
jgi:hypothetical protein